MKRFLILSLAVLVIATLLVFQATKSSAAMVLIPSEIAQDTTKSRERIRVGGRVADAPIAYQTEPYFMLSFNLRDRENPTGPQIKVEYKGLKPDMFAVDRDVIVDGDFKNGILVATNLLTQCPSKYEPPKPGQTYSQKKN